MNQFSPTDHSNLPVQPLRYYRDETTHEKIHRHLTDINDTITDEDIRNIRIIIGPSDATGISSNMQAGNR